MRDGYEKKFAFVAKRLGIFFRSNEKGEKGEHTFYCYFRTFCIILNCNGDETAKKISGVLRLLRHFARFVRECPVQDVAYCVLHIRCNSAPVRVVFFPGEKCFCDFNEFGVRSKFDFSSISLTTQLHCVYRLLVVHLNALIEVYWRDCKKKKKHCQKFLFFL